MARGRREGEAEPRRFPRRDGDEGDVRRAEELGLAVIQPRVHDDPVRGWFQMAWVRDDYHRRFGIPRELEQINTSYSVRGVLRGMHWQSPDAQGKLVWVPHGEVFDAAVDVRPDSATFGRWAGVYLSEDDGRQLYVPPGFAHGFLVTSDEALFVYAVTHHGWNREAERGLLWSDPEIGIRWPTSGADGRPLAPILSEADAGRPPLGGLGDDALPRGW